jgi:hypothetical protein
VCGNARPTAFAKKEKKQTKKIEKREGECSGKNRIGRAAKLAPMLSLQLLYFGPTFIYFTYSLTLRLPHAPPLPGFRPPSFLRHSCLPFLSSPFLLSLSYFLRPHFSTSLHRMPVDTVIDLRQRAGDIAQRLGSLSLFMPAAQELLDIVHRLNSEILLRHNRKVGPEILPLNSRRYSPINPRSRDCHPCGGRYKQIFFSVIG